MLEWLILFIMLIVVPAVLVWAVGYKAFIPDGEFDGEVVRFEIRREALVRNTGHGRRTRYVERKYPVVSYRADDGYTYEATAIIADYHHELAIGEKVRITAGRNRTHCRVKGLKSGI